MNSKKPLKSHRLPTPLTQKIVLITGASSGIGEATAYAFAVEHCKLVLASRSIENLKAVAAKCKELGAKEVLTIVCDVSSEEACQNLVNQAVSHFGTLHVLVNNAGISMRAILADCDLGVIKQVMDTNFWGTVYCTKFALPYLLENKGSVVSVSSVSGLVGLPGRTGYSASKYAIAGFMQSLRIETLLKGLHVGIVYPGYTASNIRNTALNKNGNSQAESPLDETKLMPPSVVADSIVKLVKLRKRQKILTLQGHLANFINRFFPNWVDWMVFKFVSKEKNSPF
ncbi:MAG: SDR family oxidoreductase [Bacteroidia bacterium]|jgi:short-subunit dehydrogenase|nr:SDR family oxidoreductase [Bacteroidia bacterium]